MDKKESRNRSICHLTLLLILLTIEVHFTFIYKIMSDETFTFKLPSMDPNKADQLFFEADEKIKQNLFAEAKEILEQAILTNPKHGRAHNHLAWLYETKYQDFTKASEHYQQAIEFAPEYPAGYANYAVLLCTMERYDELEKHIKRALEVPGIYKETLYNQYAIMSERQGKLDQAIENYTKALNYVLNEQGVTTYKAAIARCKSKMS